MTLFQPGAEALDAAAGLLEHLVRRGIGDAEERGEAEGRAVHDRHAFLFEK